MKKPIIGLTAAYDQEKQTFRLGTEYFRSVQAAGGLPLLLPITPNEALWQPYLANIDGFIFTGGCDITPKFYGAQTQPFCGETQDFRDSFELSLLKAALAHNKPVLAICRGHQLVNVAFGGTLYQDLSTEKPSTIVHRQPEPYETPTHDVMLDGSSPLARLLGNRIRVNSFHHQAIADLGNGLVAVGYSEDGLIEAVLSPETPMLLSVQWHPERLYQTESSARALFEQLVCWASGQVKP